MPFGFAVHWGGDARFTSRIAQSLIEQAGLLLPSVVTADGGAAGAAATVATQGNISALRLKSLLIVFDGRLDDKGDLRRRVGLGSNAGAARLVAEAYLKWGDRLATHLRGDYSFVIWDGLRSRVVAARDPFGVRPLHWIRRRGQMYLASDAGQFVAAGIAPATPDDRMVLEFLDRRFQTGGRSYFAGIFQVRPGHLLVATSDRLTTWDYRELPTSPLVFKTREECYEAFRVVFSRSVRRRLSAGSPTIIQISGGVDSACVACTADRISRGPDSGVGPIAGAAAVFSGLPCDETEHIDAVARHVNFPVERWNGTVVSDVEFLEPFVAAPGSRISWASGTEGFIHIARSRGARTVIDGTGGDQVGMPIGLERDEVTSDDWRVVWRFLVDSPLSKPRIERVLRWGIKMATPLRLRRIYDDLRRTGCANDTDWLAAPTVPNEPEYLSTRRTFVSWRHGLRWRTLSGTPLSSSIDTKQRHAAAFGLEMAFPFLDWDVIRFVMALPKAQWPRRSWLARLQREALRRQLPPSTYLRRSKADFSSALTHRVRRNLPAIRQLVTEGPWESHRYVQRTRANELLNQVAAAQDPGFAAAYQLWAIASVEAWLRRILR